MVEFLQDTHTCLAVNLEKCHLVSNVIFHIEFSSVPWVSARQITPAARGGGLLSQFPPFRYFPNFSSLSKHTLAVKYSVYIWQVSPQLSCGDTCQIWMWFEESNMYFCKIENFGYGEINERSFSNPHPNTGLMLPLHKPILWMSWMSALDIQVYCSDLHNVIEYWAPSQYKNVILPVSEIPCGDKTIVRLSYLNNGISYTGKMTSLHWIRALVFTTAGHQGYDKYSSTSRDNIH